MLRGCGGDRQEGGGGKWRGGEPIVSLLWQCRESTASLG